MTQGTPSPDLVTSFMTQSIASGTNVFLLLGYCAEMAYWTKLADDAGLLEGQAFFVYEFTSACATADDISAGGERSYNLPIRVSRPNLACLVLTSSGIASLLNAATGLAKYVGLWNLSPKPPSTISAFKANLKADPTLDFSPYLTYPYGTASTNETSPYKSTLINEMEKDGGMNRTFTPGR